MDNYVGSTFDPVLQWAVFAELAIILCVIVYSSLRARARIRRIARSSEFVEFRAEEEKCWRGSIVATLLAHLPISALIVGILCVKYFNVSIWLVAFLLINVWIICGAIVYLGSFDMILTHQGSLIALSPLFIIKEVKLSDIARIRRVTNRHEIRGITKHLCVPEKTVVLELKQGTKFYASVKEIDRFVDAISKASGLEAH